MSLKMLAGSLLLAVAASPVLLADAIPYPNPGTVAPSYTFTAQTSGDVVAYFHGSTAAFDDQLGLFVNGVETGGWALDNHTSSFGDTYDFGHVQAGDTLVFALFVNDTDSTYFSDSRLNGDGISHVYATSYSGMNNNGIFIPAGTFIGFEDTPFGDSDLNYGDEDFVFTNVQPIPPAETPEPASALLLASAGALSLYAGLFRRKRSK